MMNIALFGSVIVYLSLVLLPLRWIAVSALLLFALRNSEFFNTLGLSILKRLKKADMKQQKIKWLARLETGRAKISNTVSKAVEYGLNLYEWPLKPSIFAL